MSERQISDEQANHFNRNAMHSPMPTIPREDRARWGRSRIAKLRGAGWTIEPPSDRTDDDLKFEWLYGRRR